jgi:hypothetical protein
MIKIKGLRLTIILREEAEGGYSPKSSNSQAASAKEKTAKKPYPTSAKQ